MLRFLVICLAVVACLFAGAVGGFFLYGPERLWERVAGPADQGPVDFAGLRRSPTPNDALACSPQACSGDGTVDVALPAFRQSPEALATLLDRSVTGDANVSRVDDGSRPDYRRYVVRTPVMRFPDTVDAEAVATGDGTGLRLYSRSLLGKGDFGANRTRLREWAERLAAAS